MVIRQLAHCRFAQPPLQAHHQMLTMRLDQKRQPLIQGSVNEEVAEADLYGGVDV
jgi:hypothetical protein